jgi:hypothetical protein
LAQLVVDKMGVKHKGQRVLADSHHWSDAIRKVSPRNPTDAKARFLSVTTNAQNKRTKAAMSDKDLKQKSTATK